MGQEIQIDLVLTSRIIQSIIVKHLWLIIAQTKPKIIAVHTNVAHPIEGLAKSYTKQSVR